MSSARSALLTCTVALRELILSISSRLVFAPISLLVPRDRRLIVVMGREHGRFLDNTKHFLAWMHASIDDGTRVIFVGEHAAVLDSLHAAGVETARYPGLSAIAALLRAGTVVIDTADPLAHGRVGMLHGARLVQIWHGAPLKEVELALHRRRAADLARPARWTLAAYKAALGRYRRLDLLVSTSQFFTDAAFARCFPTRRIVNVGYPRNDVLLNGAGYSQQLVDLNVDADAAARMKAHREAGGLVVLYAPTFRDDGGSPFSEGIMPLERLSAFAQAKAALFALKMHPLMRGHRSLDGLDGVIDVRADSDVYPLLREVDVLVTDYSSIYFDFLILDRPIVFYPYDYATYVAEERALLFDYDTMTPGPKVQDVDALLSLLGKLLDGNGDQHRSARARVRALTFEYTDGNASQRLWDAMRKMEASR